MKRIFIYLSFGPLAAWATPGYLGTDVKIKAKQGDVYIVEQAGHELKVSEKRLPPDIQKVWRTKVGQTIESAIPFAAIVDDKTLANPKLPEVKGR